ncbi:chitinase 10-like [Panicum virgatum]|uniref:chitinase 10-like n=1 Tax=Panicum virgatum TaxID=38727 RepID=UPI0019D57AEE|nr:chitinase 10-like [Panicum virgatum]
MCFKEEIRPPSKYCDSSSTEWPCFPGKSYHGRGPIQLSWNFNYGPAGKALGFDCLREPGVVAGDPDVARPRQPFREAPRRRASGLTAAPPLAINL